MRCIEGNQFVTWALRITLCGYCYELSTTGYSIKLTVHDQEYSVHGS